VRYKTGAYPASTSDGTEIYNGPLTSYEHTGLSSGVSYYYRAWGVDSVGNYTTDWAQDIGTTYASTAGGNMSINIPTNDWYGGTSNSSLTDLPFFTLVEQAAADSGIASLTMWTLLAVAVSMIIGTFVYAMTGSVVLTVLGIIVGLVGGSIAGVVPFWIIFIFFRLRF
jgi:hypothetical protein